MNSLGFDTTHFTICLYTMRHHTNVSLEVTIII